MPVVFQHEHVIIVFKENIVSAHNCEGTGQTPLFWGCGRFERMIIALHEMDEIPIIH